MTDYTDLPTLRVHIGQQDAANQASDARLSALITTASRLVDRWCQRPDNGFVPQVQTRVYDVPSPASPDRGPLGYATWSVTVDVDPLLSVTAVATDQDGDGVYETTWDAGEYTLLPINAPLDGRPYDQVRSRDWTSLGGKRFPTGQARLQIAGTWGEALVVPPPIAEATILTAARLFARRLQPYGIVQDQIAGGAARIPPVDPDVERILVRAGYIATQEWWFA